jgi:hypothetical protein
MPFSYTEGSWNADKHPSAKERTVTEKPLSEPQRQEIFLALVQAQDQHLSVVQSRKQVAEQFGVSEEQVRRLEQEGIDKEWPPLS